MEEDEKVIELLKAVDGMIDDACNVFCETIKRITTTYKKETMILRRAIIFGVTDTTEAVIGQQRVVARMILGPGPNVRLALEDLLDAAEIEVDRARDSARKVRADIEADPMIAAAKEKLEQKLGPILDTMLD